MAPTSPNDTPKTSCKTSASRSAGVSVSSTTISAAPTESASSASSSGPAWLRPEARVKPGRLGRQRPSLLLPPGPAGFQHVQANPGHNRSQPPGRILHLTAVGPADPQPRLLHRVLGITARAEHPVSQRHQPAPVLGESMRQPVVLGHRSRSSVPPVISVDRRDGPDVTAGRSLPPSQRKKPPSQTRTIRRPSALPYTPVRIDLDQARAAAMPRGWGRHPASAPPLRSASCRAVAVAGLRRATRRSRGSPRAQRACPLTHDCPLHTRPRPDRQPAHRTALTSATGPGLAAHKIRQMPGILSVMRPCHSWTQPGHSCDLPLRPDPVTLFHPRKCRLGFSALLHHGPRQPIPGAPVP